MFTEALNVSTQIASATAEATDIRQRANDIRDEAIKYAVSKLPVTKQGGDISALSQRQDFLTRLKWQLASGIGQLLAQNDDYVNEVYLLDPDANPDSETGVSSGLDASVHLLVRVRKPSAALESLVCALDREVTHSLKESDVTIYANYRSVLDIVLVTDEDVRMRRGFAPLLTSVYTPPLRVC